MGRNEHPLENRWQPVEAESGKAARSNAGRRAAPQASPDAPGLKPIAPVILADHEDGPRMVARLVLEGAGLRTHAATTAAELHDVLDAHPNTPTIIVDLQLPELDLGALDAHLARLPRRPGLILLRHPHTRFDTQPPSAHDCIVKPFSPNAVLKSVRDAIANLHEAR
jgi:CheY-like chemotaxis protein